MRAVLQVFENYQKARVNFVQTVAELATRPQNIEALQNAGVMQLLRPLLLDNVPSIQQSAALALGRLANYNDELAEAVVSNEVLPQLVYSLSEQNRFYKKAAAFVLRAVAKHSPQLAQAVVFERVQGRLHEGRLPTGLALRKPYKCPNADALILQVMIAHVVADDEWRLVERKSGHGKARSRPVRRPPAIRPGPACSASVAVPSGKATHASILNLRTTRRVDRKDNQEVWGGAA